MCNVPEVMMCYHLDGIVQVMYMTINITTQCYEL